jgi:hypothetical protein
MTMDDDAQMARDVFALTSQGELPSSSDEFTAQVRDAARTMAQRRFRRRSIGSLAAVLILAGGLGITQYSEGTAKARRIDALAKPSELQAALIKILTSRSPDLTIEPLGGNTQVVTRDGRTYRLSLARVRVRTASDVAVLTASQYMPAPPFIPSFCSVGTPDCRSLSSATGTIVIRETRLGGAVRTDASIRTASGRAFQVVEQTEAARPSTGAGPYVPSTARPPVQDSGLVAILGSFAS